MCFLYMEKKNKCIVTTIFIQTKICLHKSTTINSYQKWKNIAAELFIFNHNFDIARYLPAPDIC